MCIQEKIVKNFAIAGEVVSQEPYGNGHINDTRLVVSKDGEKTHRYILQKINKNVFKNPPELMKNYVSVTEFIRNKIVEAGGDPERETLNVIKALDGKEYISLHKPNKVGEERATFIEFND